MFFALVARYLSTRSGRDAGEQPHAPGDGASLEVDAPAPASLDAGAAGRLEAMVRAHFQFVYRTLRRTLSEGAVDDAVQQTFVVAVRNVDRIQPGSERAFLGRTAVWVAAFVRRTQARRRETADADAIEREAESAPTPEEHAEDSARRRMLDEVLASMDADLRAVFVLFELEGMPSHEIAPMLGIPAGTVASRLRRAREQFHAGAKRLRARAAFAGGKP
jgi:RNA polymerase sigma-70 factor, ECF subfamily